MQHENIDPYHQQDKPGISLDSLLTFALPTAALADLL